MKTILIALTGFFFPLLLAGQSAVFVLRCSGGVQYYTQAGAKPQALSPGMELSAAGIIECKDQGSARLICNGATTTITGNKTFRVQEFMQSAGKPSQMSFTGRFMSFLSENLKGSASPGSLEKHHRDYMDKVGGGVKGWSKAEYTIKPLLIGTGKMPAAKVSFAWRPVAGQGPYTFYLLAENGGEIARISVRDTIITLDLDQLALRLESEYAWKVTRGASDQSANIPFVLISPALSIESAGYGKDPGYMAADAPDRLLMQVYSLEQERCYYSAYQMYRSLLSSDPGNGLFNRLYGAFLARMDMMAEANTSLFSNH